MTIVPVLSPLTDLTENDLRCAVQVWIQSELQAELHARSTGPYGRMNSLCQVILLIPISGLLYV